MLDSSAEAAIDEHSEIVSNVTEYIISSYCHNLNEFAASGPTSFWSKQLEYLIQINDGTTQSSLICDVAK
jgi:hypothetical protein